MPVEVVVVGHFDDRRSTACPPDVESACRDRFVVDRVDWVDGETVPLSVENLLDGQTATTLAQIQTMIANQAPTGQILSAVVVDGPTGLGRIEPEVVDGVVDLTKYAVIWVVRVLESEGISTYLVDDGGDEFYMTRSVQGGGDAEPATFSFLLTSVPDRPVTIDVVDRAGILADAHEATPDQVSRPWAAGGRMSVENLTPDTVLVRWTDTVCARRPRLTVEADPIAGGRHRALHLSDARPACDAMGIGRGVVLRFNVDVDADDLGVSEEIEIFDP